MYKEKQSEEAWEWQNVEENHIRELKAMWYTPILRFKGWIERDEHKNLKL